MPTRRQVLQGATGAAVELLLAGLPAPASPGATRAASPASRPVTLFLAGDVMTGRGVDQILPHPSEPTLYEPQVRDARDYVRLAERKSGPIPRAAGFAYIWGEALAELNRRRPHVRLINLETSVTQNAEPAPKGINYRMHPDNVPCLTAAAIGCCALANNHVLDWGDPGLAGTLETLRHAGIRTAGAGADLAAAQAPAILPVPGAGRALVFAAATGDSGVPAGWAATRSRPGVYLLPDLSPTTLREVAGRIRGLRKTGDVVVFSVHWGGNWGFEIPRAQRVFARGLIDEGAADIVHGHSAHHVKAIEVHRHRLILYGCGDLLTDYEGIGGREEFRGELGIMHFPTLHASGALAALDMVPTRVRRFRLTRATGAEAAWLRDTLRRESAAPGALIEQRDDGTLTLGV